MTSNKLYFADSCIATFGKQPSMRHAGHDPTMSHERVGYYTHRIHLERDADLPNIPVWPLYRQTWADGSSELYCLHHEFVDISHEVLALMMRRVG